MLSRVGVDERPSAAAASGDVRVVVYHTHTHNRQRYL